MRDTPSPDISRWYGEAGTVMQGLALGIVVPLAFFLLAEVTCRAFCLDQPRAEQVALEMPTWMLKEENTRARAARASADPLALEWLSLFESAPGIRVRLIPHISRDVVNTFARTAQDRARRYHIESNSWGFRGPEITEAKDPKSIRVLVFGDSSSYGWGVNQDEMYSTLLQRALAAELSDTRVEVGNFAIPGDSSEYGRLIFEEYAERFMPDVVVLGFGANDAKPSLAGHQEQVDRFRATKQAQRLLSLARTSALFRAMEQLIGSLGRASPTSEESTGTKRRPAVPRRRYQANLRAMIDGSRELGARAVVVLTLCTPGNYARSAEKVAHHTNALFLNGQRTLLHTLPDLERGEVYPKEVHDLRAFYGDALAHDPLLMVTSDACHPNALGHRLIADALASTLQERLL